MEASLPANVAEAITKRFGPITLVGAGAWSTAFRFNRDDAELVVRVGEHGSDFRVDAEMSAYASPSLPIPTIVEMDRLDPPHDQFHICVSTFAPGEPLELASAQEWALLVPEVADMLDAMQAATPPVHISASTWPEVLLSHNDGDGRLKGSHNKLAAQPAQLVAYQKSMERLRELCTLPHVANVTPTLVHCDLINRNVHVEQGKITGVFDWGCRRWGDHLYDLAWFDFWAPLHPNLDVGALRSEMVNRWGEEPDPDRLAACLTHIGADHLVYNAAIDNIEGSREVLDRLDSLDLL